MAWLSEWIRNLTFYFIFLSAVMNFLPGGEEKKYIRYFMGILLILLLFGPLLRLGDLGESIEQHVLSGSLEEAFEEMMRETGRQELVGRDYVKEACEQEIQEQVSQLARIYGYEVTGSRIDFFDGDVLELKEITVSIRAGEEADSSSVQGMSPAEREEFLKKKLEEVYNIPAGNINISIQG